MPLFLDAAQRPHAVFTRRRADLRRHAGEISFPGGRRDPDDADLRETALREAEEEIGLPRGDVRVLGELAPTSTFVTGYLIHPFVGLIPAGEELAALAGRGGRGARAAARRAARGPHGARAWNAAGSNSKPTLT